MGVIPTIGPRWALLYIEGQKYLGNGAPTLLHSEESKDAVLPTHCGVPHSAQTGVAVTTSRCWTHTCSPLGQGPAIKIRPNQVRGEENPPQTPKLLPPLQAHVDTKEQTVRQAPRRDQNSMGTAAWGT